MTSAAETGEGLAWALRRAVRAVWRNRRSIARALVRFAVLASAVAIFATLAAEVHAARELELDRRVFTALASVEGPALTRVARGVTRLGDGIVLAPLVIGAGLWLWRRGHPHSAVFVVAAGAGAGVLNTVLKAVFGRARPDSLAALELAGSFSFPSGHSMGSAAVYGAFAVLAMARFPSARWLVASASLALIAAVGASRAYLRVHFPSDVLAGWALGILWPLSLAPLVLGRELRAKRAKEPDLRADGFEHRGDDVVERRP